MVAVRARRVGGQVRQLGRVECCQEVVITRPKVELCHAGVGFGGRGAWPAGVIDRARSGFGKRLARRLEPQVPVAPLAVAHTTTGHQREGGELAATFLVASFGITSAVSEVGRRSGNPFPHAPAFFSGVRP